MSNLLVLGGSGFVGSHLIPLLAARGHRVWLPSRRPERCKSVLPGVEVMQADVDDPTTLRTLCMGKDAVINLVGILHERKAGDFERAHVELPRKLLTAGVTRLLHVSALGAEADSNSRYQQTKAAGEALARTLPGTTVFRPSVIFGPGDSFLTMFADLIKFAPVVPLAGGYARFQPVYVGDVARAIAESLDRPETMGQRYDLCGPRVYALAELLHLTAAALGLHRIVLPLGATASYWFARLMELKPGDKIMTRDNFYAMQRDNVCPSGCVQAFGEPTALESVIAYLGRPDPRCNCADFRAHAGR